MAIRPDKAFGGGGDTPASPRGSPGSRPGQRRRRTESGPSARRRLPDRGVTDSIVSPPRCHAAFLRFRSPGRAATALPGNSTYELIGNPRRRAKTWSEKRTEYRNRARRFRGVFTLPRTAGKRPRTESRVTWWLHSAEKNSRFRFSATT